MPVTLRVDPYSTHIREHMIAWHLLEPHFLDESDGTLLARHAHDHVHVTSMFPSMLRRHTHTEDGTPVFPPPSAQPVRSEGRQEVPSDGRAT